jgi:hypothetical protein
MLFDQYKKMLDRRSVRYGIDENLKDSMHDADNSPHLDFGTLGHWEESEYNGTPLNPKEFFLPFDNVAAEAAMIFKGGEKGRMLLLTGRPNGDAEANLVDDDWSMMIGMTSNEAPNLIRIYKALMKVHRIREDRHRRDDYKCAPFSDCVYEINSGKCVYSWCGDPDIAKTENEKTKKEIESLGEHMVTLATTMLSLIETANSPANWIVRVSDEQARVVKRRGKRTKENRTRYIVVPDRDLDKVLRRSNDASDFIEKAPHRRRAHYRRLDSPRYRLKRGQRIFVKESWVGPKEAVIGSEKYTVLTSLPSSAN